MRAVAWSLVGTLLAAVLVALDGRGVSDHSLRILALGGGGALALVGALLGLIGRFGREPTSDALIRTPPPATRFFLDRRRTPRHEVRLPVRLSVNGRTYPATLLSVSASGALLRLRLDPGEMVHAQQGQPVRIEDYPAGTLARIGRSGVYVDFAIRFEPTPVAAPPDAVLVQAGIGRSFDT